MTFKDDLLHHKTMAELQYVVSLYSDVELFDEYKIDPKHISNAHWRIYYMILDKMIERKKITKIDEINVDLFVSEQTEQLRTRYENAGGFKTIEDALSIIEVENIETYYREVLRYTALLRLFEKGYPVEEEWDVLKSLSYSDLSDVVESSISEIFADIDMGEDKVHDIMDGIDQMLEDADAGIGKGLPLYSKALNSVVNGQSLGNITMLGGTSGIGKTYLTLCLTLPTVIEEEEPLLIMCNEEDLAKWQREILTWVANNVICKEKGSDLYGSEFIKSRFYQGDFTNEEWSILRASKEWLNERLENGLIRFVNFNSFAMGKSIKLIRKYKTQYDVNYFIIDTLKLDNDIGASVTDLAWLQLQQNMVKLYNVIKPTSKNVHVWVTYQLNKSVRTRYLDQSALGMSKNVADVVATLLLVRDVLESEKGTDAKALKVKAANGGIKMLDEDKDYMVCFIDKNRQGSTSNQVVWRTDKGRNILRDVGFTRISQDY